MASSTTFSCRGKEALVPYVTKIQQNLQKQSVRLSIKKDYDSLVNDHFIHIIIPISAYNSIHNITPHNQNKEEMKIYQNISNKSKWTGSISIWKRKGLERKVIHINQTHMTVLKTSVE